MIDKFVLALAESAYVHYEHFSGTKYHIKINSHRKIVWMVTCNNERIEIPLPGRDCIGVFDRDTAAYLKQKKLHFIRTIGKLTNVKWVWSLKDKSSYTSTIALEQITIDLSAERSQRFAKHDFPQFGWTFISFSWRLNLMSKKLIF